LRPSEIRLLLSAAFAVIGALVFSSCETAKTARALPAYEPPMHRSDFQNVRTTAYTHTEADHTQYTNHNALGGELHAAGPAIHRAENVMRARAISDSDENDYQRVSNSGSSLQPFSLEETRTTTRVTKTTRGAKRAIAVARKPKIGSAAADWSRWPVGTTFRLLSTGQIYRVDDYGWALSGRNTIDLYMSTRSEMNNWGARQEPIQILQWGDSQESLRFLTPHQNYKHIRRMVLELQGNEQEAAVLQ
jgi:3D (Asp-Asp-Asp) domain-containing protein/predicted outer membrane lipoprotein